MDFLRTIDTESTLVGAASRTTQQALEHRPDSQHRRDARDRVPEHDARQPVEAGREGHQVQRHVAGARAESPDLLLSARRLRHPSESGRHAGEPAPAGQSGHQGVLRRHAWSSASDHQVTTFTLSDFGRTLQPAGIGRRRGRVAITRGATIISLSAARCAAATSTASPDRTAGVSRLQLSGPSDTDNRGRWIPTASVEQYAATLASWYRRERRRTLPIVFPNIGRFSTSDLGFMG